MKHAGERLTSQQGTCVSELSNITCHDPHGSYTRRQKSRDDALAFATSGQAAAGAHKYAARNAALNQQRCSPQPKATKPPCDRIQTMGEGSAIVL